MSEYFLQRAVYHLSLPPREGVSKPDGPASGLAELLKLVASPEVAKLRGIDLRLDLTDDELNVISRGDVAEMYRRGVHPNIVRNFAGNFGINYVDRYREAGLRDD